VEFSTPLPAWLNLSPTGLLYGTPAQTGVFKFLIRAADSLNSFNYGIREFVFTSSPIVITSPAMPSWTNTLTPFDYTITYTGGTGATFSVPTYSALPDGLSLNASTGRIFGTPTAAGAYTFTVLVTDPVSGTTRTLSYTVNFYPVGAKPPLNLSIGPAFTRSVGSWSEQLAASGGSGSYVYSYAPGATPIPGMRVQNRAGGPLPTSFPTSVTGGLIGILATPGSYPTTIRVTDAVDSQYFDRQITVAVSTVSVFNPDGMPRAVVNIPYSYQFIPSGGTPPYSWSPGPGGIPAGWNLTSTGLLTGTPASAAFLNFSVTVTDSATPIPNSYTGTWKLEIAFYEITSPAVLPAATVNTLYSYTFTAAVAVQEWSVIAGISPGGMTLNPTTGVISGTQIGRAHV
jgi:hypothetical protein